MRRRTACWPRSLTPVGRSCMRRVDLVPSGRGVQPERGARGVSPGGTCTWIAVRRRDVSGGGSRVQSPGSTVSAEDGAEVGLTVRPPGSTGRPRRDNGAVRGLRAKPKALVRFGTLGLVVAWLTVVIAGIAPRVLAADTVTAVTSDHAGAVALAQAMVQDSRHPHRRELRCRPAGGNPQRHVHGTRVLSDQWGYVRHPHDGRRHLCRRHQRFGQHRRRPRWKCRSR